MGRVRHEGLKELEEAQKRSIGIELVQEYAGRLEKARAAVRYSL